MAQAPTNIVNYPYGNLLSASQVPSAGNLANLVNYPWASRFNPFQTVGPEPFQGGVPIFRIAVYDGKNPNQLKYQYTFPISPSNYTKEVASLSTAYNTPSANFYGGIARIIDQYGITPPVWKFKGTTGFQYHAADNFNYTGNQSLKLLFNYITQYSKDQAVNTSKNSPLDIMEINDYFDDEHWYVVPVGPQATTRSASAPLWGFYDLTFFGLVPAGTGMATQSFFINDLIITALSEDPFTLETTLQNLGSEIQQVYSVTGIP